MSTAEVALGHDHDHSHAHDAHGHGHHELSFIQKYVFSEDHKMIGLQFLFTTLLMLFLGGGLALGVRWQVAFPWTDLPILGRILFSETGGQMSPEFYTMLFTMHATVMIFSGDHPDSGRRVRKLSDPAARSAPTIWRSPRSTCSATGSCGRRFCSSA